MKGDFTLSYHYFTQRDSRNHLELFLDIDGISPLETWRNFNGREQKRRFTAAPAHRRVYLTYSGVISGNRGRLRVLRNGKFIDRRARMAEVDAAHDVHRSVDRRARMADSIRVIL